MRDCRLRLEARYEAAMTVWGAGLRVKAHCAAAMTGRRQGADDRGGRPYKNNTGSHWGPPAF
ncbi:MAG: hypothetical protein FWH01_16765 [Oscillospiraceae bacterium]|nr:hypothetical protein [Oscillospiraceae bacterium]